MTQENLQTVSLPNKTMKGYELIRASDIVTREISWLWYPFIPFGKVTLLQGDPGDGKSTFMLTIAALLTRGEPLPFANAETAAEPMNVIYQTTEDDAEDTVVPRFIKANGNRDKLLFINEKDKPIFFYDGRIEAAIKDAGAKMLILDPLSSYIGDCQINAANEVRPRFNHLIRVAKETGCAIVIINHLNKMFGIKAIYRTPGSIDIVGAARSALLIGKDRNDENVRFLVQQKANLAPTGAAIKFTIGKDGIVFLEETEMTADELLSGYSSGMGRPDTKMQEAIRLVREMLTEQNDLAAAVCEAKLREAGISRSTAKKAKRTLGVESFKSGFAWLWHLPENNEN